ncbi:hypothetical protein NRP93_001476 [Clostridium botulinum]|nr:hypothetical protein [Clostridium botulinum]
MEEEYQKISCIIERSSDIYGQTFIKPTNPLLKLLATEFSIASISFNNPFVKEDISGIFT